MKAFEDYEKGPLLYEGKGKKVFGVAGKKDSLFLEFKDQLTAFNAQKKGEFAQKGEFNRAIASIVFRFLQKKKIISHWVADIGDHEMIVKKLNMIALEVVVRNIVAGSLAKKLNVDEGKKLKAPVVEFFFKDDALGDPFINDDHALMLNVVKSKRDLQDLKIKALKINSALKQLFSTVGIDLVDFKLEFGRDRKGKIVLGDEITPDSCRLWDRKTGEKLDKDRFRRDLGNIKESYEEVLNRLQSRWGQKL